MLIWWADLSEIIDSADMFSAEIFLAPTVHFIRTLHIGYCLHDSVVSDYEVVAGSTCLEETDSEPSSSSSAGQHYGSQQSVQSRHSRLENGNCWLTKQPVDMVGGGRW